MADQTPLTNQELYTELIKKQITIFGPDITFMQLERISGLEVSKDGTVTKLPNDKDLAQKYIDLWNHLSPFLAKKIAKSTLSIAKAGDSEIPQ